MNAPNQKIPLTIDVSLLAKAVLHSLCFAAPKFIDPSKPETIYTDLQGYAVAITQATLPRDQGAVEVFLGYHRDMLQPPYVLECEAHCSSTQVKLQLLWTGDRQQACLMALMHNVRSILDLRTRKTLVFNDPGREDA